MFVILEGQFQARGELGGETVVIPFEAGRRDRSAALFPDEAVRRDRPGGHGRPRPEISGFASFPNWCRKCRS